MDRLIMTPGDPGFWEIYHSTPPPGERISPFYVVDSQTLELRNVDECGLSEYQLGGEHDVMWEFWNCA